jgi:glucose-6-phosphate 1-dehydrogenase
MVVQGDGGDASEEFHHLDVWKALPSRNFSNYAAGTWGPKEAEELIGRHGQQWRRSNA